MGKKRIKVLDTNLFLLDPSALTAFAPTEDEDETTIMLSPVVLEEIDKFKNESSERGYNARETYRRLVGFDNEVEGNLYDGLPVLPNCTIQSSVKHHKEISQKLEDLLRGYDSKKPDNKIIALGLYLQELEHSAEVEFITNDMGALVTARSLGLNADKWKDKDDFQEYQGWREIEDRDLANKLKKDHFLKPEEVNLEGGEWHPNEYLLVKSHEEGWRGSDTLVARYDTRQERLVAVQLEHRSVQPRNAFQKMYMDALFNKDIHGVFGIGAAGAGKTFLSLYAGYVQALKKGDNPYARGVLTRPRVLDKSEIDVGTPPGEVLDKVSPWFGSIIDNLNQLSKIGNMGKDKNMMHIKEQQIGEMLQDHCWYIADSQYITGRSISESYWNVEEAQNLSRKRVLAVATRPAEGTKIVMNGDPFQNERPGETALKNSLVWASSRFATSELTATIHFPHYSCERSDFVKEALERLGPDFS